MERRKIEATAETFTAEVKEAPKKEPEKIVRFKLFKDGDRYSGNKFVGVNGKGYLIKRGEWVDLPESVYNVLVLSEEQIQVAERVMEDSRMVEYK